MENKINATIQDWKLDTNKISDGYHTFGELYEHRIALFIALCRAITHLVDECGNEEQRPWKSKAHSHGPIFKGWFIMGIGKDKGKQITYHLPIKYWSSLEEIETLDKAPKFDGHTPIQVIDRLLQL